MAAHQVLVGDSGGGWAPSSVRTSRRLNRIELSHSDQLLYCRLIDRRAALSDRGPRRSRRRRQQSLPHGTQITPSTVTCQSACAEAEDRPSRGGALRSSFRKPQYAVPASDLLLFENQEDLVFRLKMSKRYRTTLPRLPMGLIRVQPYTAGCTRGIGTFNNVEVGMEQTLRLT